MTAAQHAFLRIFRHVGDLALVFAGRTHIDERLFRLALRERFIGKGANLLVHPSRRHGIICVRIFRHFARHLAAIGFPFVAAAVENLHLLVSEQTERPERVAGPPVRFVAVENTGRFGRDPVATAKFGEFFRRDVIANHRILQIGPPIDVDRAGNVTGVVKQDVLIRFDDADVLVVEVLFEPSRRRPTPRDARIPSGSYSWISIEMVGRGPQVDSAAPQLEPLPLQ